MSIRIVCYWVLACALCHLQAQGQSSAPLRGVISILNSKTQTGKTQYVRTAEVRASKANPALTDSEGRFKLTFIDSEPGIEVELDIAKEGLEVVNKEALKAVLRKDPDFLLKIYMCDPEQLAASVLKYRGVAEKFIVAKYQAKIIQLKKENKAKAAAILELEDQKAAALRQFQDIAARLAAVNLDEAPGIYKQALELFQQGKLDEALALIEKADLDAQLQNAVKQKAMAQQLVEQSQQRIEDIANTYMLQARLHVANLALAQAQESYRKAIAARDSAFIDDNLEYARLLIAQNQSWKAIPLLAYTLGLCTPTGPDAAYTQFLLGSAQLNQVEVQQAIQHLTESVQHYAGLTEKDPLHYGSFAGVAILTCAAAHLFNSNQAAAAEIASYGSKIFGALMQTDTLRYMPYYAWSLYAEAALTLRHEHIDKVIEYYTFLADTQSPRYQIFLGAGKILKAAILRDSMTTAGLDAQTVGQIEATSDQLYSEGLQMLLQQLEGVQRSYPNIGFMVSGPDELPDFVTLMEASDYPVSVLFSGLQVWWLRQALYGQQEGLTTEQVLKLIVEKTRMLASQNRDRYLPHYAQYTAFLGFNYALNKRSMEAIPLIKEGLKLVDDPDFARNPTQGFLHSVLEAQLGIAHAFCCLEKGDFCETTKQELLQLCERVTEKLSAYSQFPMMDQTLLLLDMIHQGLIKSNDVATFRLYLNYRNTLTGFLQSVEKQDNEGIYVGFLRLQEALETFLNEQFIIEDARLLDTIYYAQWIEIYAQAEQLESLPGFTNQAIALKYDLINAGADNDKALRTGLSKYFSDLAWAALQKEQYRIAVEMAGYATAFDAGNARAPGIKAHALMLGAQQKRALRLYLEWCNKPSDSESSTMCKTMFLNELSQLPASNTSADATQVKAILEGGSQAPELLTKGLTILQEANKRWKKGFDGLMFKQNAQQSFSAAKQWYDQLLRPPYLQSGYFDDDYAEIWFKIEFAARFQGKTPPGIPIDYTAATLDQWSRQLLRQSYAALSGSHRDSLWLWSEKLKTAVNLAETAHERSPKSEDIALNLALVYGQCAYAQLLWGQKDEALALAQKALAITTTSPEVLLSVLPVYYVNGKMEETKNMAKTAEQHNLIFMGVERSWKNWLKSRLYQLTQLGLIGDDQFVYDLLGW